MKRIFITHIIFLSLTLISCTATQTSMQNGGEAESYAVNKEENITVSEVMLGAGDEIEVKVYRHDDLNTKTRISPDGIIFFPLIGEVEAKGIGIRQLREKITEGFSKYIVNPQISIEVTAFKGQKIYILGEVRNPGVYQIDPPITILEAVSRAGGFTMDGKDNSVLLIRGELTKPELKALDLEKALKEGDLTQNVSLQRGDIVYVPRTFISNVDRFFMHFENIIRPIVTLEQGIVLYPKVEDVITGKEAGKGDTTIIIAPR